MESNSFLGNLEILEIDKLQKVLIEALNVEAILCFGSYATGLQDKFSDIDLQVFVKELSAPAKRREAYQKLPNVKIISLDTNLEHWESAWMAISDKLELNGREIEIGFNTIAWLEKIIHHLIEKHEVSIQELPFRPWAFLGLLESSISLYDKDQRIEKIKKRLRPYPIELKKAIVQISWPTLNDCYNDLDQSLKRETGNLAYQFYVFMGLDAAIQLIWIINDTYDPASKRTEFFLSKLQNLPEGFMDFINKDLPKCFDDRKTFVNHLGEIKYFIENNLNDLRLMEPAE